MTTAFDIAIDSSEATCLGTLCSTFQAPTVTAQDIEQALLNPIGAEASGTPVYDLIQPGESVCLVVSDHTRKTASAEILPVLLRGLTARGCRVEDLFFLVASGIHRRPTAGEIRRILGAEVAAAFTGRIFFHDPDDAQNLVSIGKTRRGHEVRLNRRAVEADRLILIGAALYHYHAGFGGGRKSLVPGLAARETIAYNHSLTLDPSADRIRPGVEIGCLDGNAVAEEMLECAQLNMPDFIINTALTPDGKLAGVFAGDMDLAHRTACRRVEMIDRVDLTEPADFVIASAGTASNWVQSHKALFNASRAIKPEGRIVLLAPCPEGIGDEQFRHWVKQPIDQIYKGLRNEPEILGQTALSTRIRGARTVLVTSMTAADAADLGIRTAPDLKTAVSTVRTDLRQCGRTLPTYYLMPDALSVVPFTR